MNPIDAGEEEFLAEMRDEPDWPWIDDSGDPFIEKWTREWMAHFETLSAEEQGHIHRNWEDLVLRPFYRAR
jgi:hypothetical protein